MNTLKTKKILVCGSRYGQSYLPIVFQDPELELAGIYSTGGDRSIRLSEQYGVDNHISLSEIENDIDLACIALPHDIAISTAESLLKKKIKILIEHPIQLKGVNRLIDASNAASTPFHINSHFSELPPANNFIEHCKTLNLKSTPYSISVQCNSRTFYSCLDILMRCFGIFSFGIQSIEKNQSYYHCSLTIQKTPCSLIYQAWKHSEDNSQDSPLGHNITVTYPEGSLQLCNSFGPCLWLPTVAYNMPSSSLNNIPQTSPHSHIPEVHEIVQWRKQANTTSIHRLLQSKTPPMHQTIKYLRHLCFLWESLSNNFKIKISANNADN